MLKRCLLLLPAAFAAWAAPGEEAEPSATAVLGQGGQLIPGWQPAVFNLSNPTSSPLRVLLSVEPQGADGRSWQRVEREVDLPASGRQRQVLLFRCEAWTTAVRLSAGAPDRELLDREKRKVEVSLRNAWQATPTVLALAPPGASWVQEIRSVSTRNFQGNQDRFDLVEGTAESLPSRPEGFGKVEVVLCSGFPFEKAGDGTPDALAAWTASGGHLVLTASPQGLPAGLVARIPALKGYSVSTARTFASLERACGAPLPPHGEATCLDGRPAGIPPTVVLPGMHRFPWGRGWISVLLVDPGLQPFRGWSGMQKLWASVLQPQPPAFPEFFPARDERFGYDAMAYEDSVRPALCTVLKKGLARTLPAGVISGVVVAYLLLMGPVQFLLLRRFWSPTRAVVTIPALAALFTVGIMVLGYATRGVGTRVNLATLHLALPQGGELVRTYAAVFSSFPGTLEAGLSPGAAGEVLFPAKEASEEGFHVLKDASLGGLSVRMWSTRFLGASRHEARRPPLSVAEGRIRNDSPARFERLVALDDKGAAGELGPLDPGQDCRAEPAAWGKAQELLPYAEGFEPAFLRGLADQCRPGRWVMGVSRRSDDALLSPSSPAEAPLSVTLLRLP